LELWVKEDLDDVLELELEMDSLADELLEEEDDDDVDDIDDPEEVESDDEDELTTDVDEAEDDWYVVVLGVMEEAIELESDV
jgi:hypothetical protein